MPRLLPATNSEQALTQEVIMKSQRNYFPSVDLKNVHIPLT